MAYNGYGNGAGGYGQSNPYQSNPYQNANTYGSQDRYGNQPPYPTENVEMQPMPDQNNPFSDPSNPYGAPQQQRDPHAILNQCRQVGQEIDALERPGGELDQLRSAQRAFVQGSGASHAQVDSKSAEVMAVYRAMADRVKRIKSQPEATNPTNAPQVNSLDRRIKKAIQAWQQQESAFRKDVQDQQRRQYLIVNPNATDAEIREVTEAGSGDMQIFSQALMNADRRGQAQSTLANVRQRHDAIQQIERTMVELAQLFQDLDAIVVAQEPLVQNIETKAEETNTHMQQATVELGGAVKSARAARKKKWICLGISILILVIVVAAVLGYGSTQGWFSHKDNNNNN